MWLFACALVTFNCATANWIAIANITAKRLPVIARARDFEQHLRAYHPLFSSRLTSEIDEGLSRMVAGQAERTAHRLPLPFSRYPALPRQNVANSNWISRIRQLRISVFNGDSRLLESMAVLDELVDGDRRELSTRSGQ